MTNDVTCMMSFYWGFNKLPVKQAHIDARNKLQIMDPEYRPTLSVKPCLKAYTDNEEYLFADKQNGGDVVKLPYPKCVAAWL